MSDEHGLSTAPHPMRRAEDLRDPRVDVVLNELAHIKKTLQGVDAKVTTQNGRIGKLEHQALIDSTREETLAQVVKERGDHNLRVLSLVVTLVGAAVTLAVKLL